MKLKKLKKRKFKKVPFSLPLAVWLAYAVILGFSIGYLTGKAIWKQDATRWTTHTESWSIQPPTKRSI